MFHMLKILSGGQTGVDRGALDAALELAILCGGWCPPGRKAEDGRIPDRYPLQEMEHGSYRDRTLKNVLDSGGTVIIYFGELAGGTAQTLEFCKQNKKPYLLIDATNNLAQQAAAKMKDFVSENSIVTLNVAGPRGSKEPQAHQYTFNALSTLFI